MFVRCDALDLDFHTERGIAHIGSNILNQDILELGVSSEIVRIGMMRRNTPGMKDDVENRIKTRRETQLKIAYS